MRGLVRTVAACLVVLAGVTGLVGLPGPAGAQEAPGGGAGEETAGEEPGRVLLLALPGITWADLAEHDLPAIEGLLADSALADLAPRGVSPRATPGAAYLTISAGSRATSSPSVDGQQLATGEESGGSTAGEIFLRRTGTRPDGDYVALAWPSLVRVNAGEPYDAVLGLLSDTLESAGLGAVAIGNADGTDTIGPSYERQVGLSVVTRDGVIPAGDLGADLLVADPAAPFGRRLDHDAVTAAFDRAWSSPSGGLVVVEASDLARTLRYRDRVDRARFDELWADALRDTDDLVAELLEEVDLERDTVLTAAPYNQTNDRDLTIVGLHRPGIDGGYLRSASTQRSGFLTLVDLAPTILRSLDVPRPVEMEGRPAEHVASGADYETRVERLVQLNAASRFRERTLFPTTLVVVLVLAGLSAACAVLVARRSTGRGRRVVRWLALVDMAMLPMSYLARAFPLEDLGSGFYWAFVVTGAVLTAGAATLLATRLGRPRAALVAVLLVVLAVPVGDVMTGSRLSLSAAFGYSPTGNSRLYGISNYSFGQVAAAACLLAAFLAAREPLRRSRLLALAFLGFVLVVIGVPIWGSDVGGIIAFTPTILMFAALLWRRGVNVRNVVIGAVLTVAAVTAFGLVDLARPPEQRAHLGRLFERVGNEGLEPLLSIMERKFLANLRVSTTSFWIAAVPVAVAFLLFLSRYQGRPLTMLKARIPTLQAGLSAAIVAAVLGSLVNDSGAIVGGVTMTVVTASLVCLVLEP
ncbi:MAG TPA: hypothetical protein VIL36_09880, partial [Acidimicrobiales bacterium]